MLKAQGEANVGGTGADLAKHMHHFVSVSPEKPYDIHERLLIFACDIVATAQFLHNQGGVARALCYQVLAAGTSTGANAEEGDGASSRADFIAKNRIALKEAKETRFRLRVCRRCNLLDGSYDALVSESDELVRIIGAIVHTAIRRKAEERAARKAAASKMRRASRRNSPDTKQ